MNLEHTNEPWEQEGLAIYAVINGRKTMIAQLGCSSDAWVTGEQSEANVRRIVACVNLLKRHKTALIEAAVEYDNAPDDAKWEPPHPIFMLAKERDVLHAALKKIAGMKIYDEESGASRNYSECQNIAREAIA